MLKHTTNREELPHKQPYIYTTNSTKNLKHDLTSKQIILFSKTNIESSHGETIFESSRGSKRSTMHGEQIGNHNNNI